MSVAALLAAHGSPLWLADADRVRDDLAAFRAAWSATWADTDVAYSYKTNRTTSFLCAVADAGAGAEVVCAAEYALARDVVGVPGERITVNGPAKPAPLLERAAADGALVVADSASELERLALAGVRRAGIRVSLPSPSGAQSRFGVVPAEVLAAGRRARGLGLELEILAMHLVSTDFVAPPDAETTLGAAVRVGWAKDPAFHAGAAGVLAGLAAELGVTTLDLGGGWPAAPAVGEHARAVADALAEVGFRGRLMLEPGRALVAGAVDLAATVLGVKALADGRPCAVLDAGTNLLPGALWGWPALEALAPRGDPASPTLVSGPLCLNVDVVHPAAALGELVPGDVVVARGVGAYQQVQSTQFGDLRPAVVVRDGGRWRLERRRETLEELIGHEEGKPSWSE